MMMWFKTTISIFSNRLLHIPDILGMPAAESAVFGRVVIEEVHPRNIPKKALDFFQGIPEQLELPFEAENERGRGDT